MNRIAATTSTLSEAAYFDYLEPYGSELEERFGYANLVKDIAFGRKSGIESLDALVVRLCLLAKQDYLLTRVLEREVIIVPSSRMVKNLREKSERIAKRLEALASASELSDALLDELRWLTGLMAAFARYGEEEFDAV